MKIETSFEIRGERFTSYTSMPELTIEGLTQAVRQLAWTAEQKAPRVRVIES